MSTETPEHQMTDSKSLLELAERVEALTEAANSCDVLCEIALFKPAGDWVAVRPNNAGTKVIYTDKSGEQFTYWADDWTRDDQRKETAAALRALAGQP
jgi:hypothetical protein